MPAPPTVCVPLPTSYAHPGSELTPDEIAFGKAMHRYQLQYRRRYPAWREVLYVLRTLGYRQVVPPAEAAAEFAEPSQAAA